MSWKNTFAALQHRNYRLWFYGQLISLLGTWMQITAQGFLVYEITHSPAFLGYVGFANGIPVWLFTPYAGVLADRISRRKMIMITQTVMMLLAAVLAVLTFTHTVQAWHIVLLSLLLGAANAFDAPTRQTFVVEMVGKEDLLNAISLNSTMFNTGTAIGPAVAGLAYVWFGPGWCFSINAVSFLAVLYALSLMKLSPAPPKEKEKSVWQDLKEGFLYVGQRPVMLVVMVIVIMTCMFGLSFATLAPAWAVKKLHGDATVNGLLQSARGLGAFLGALIMASLSRYLVKGKVLNLANIVFPIMILIFSFITWLPLSLVVLVAIGASSLFIFNMANGILQTLVSDEYRGRVMGMYALTFLGFMPPGSLLAGMLAQHLSETAAVQINAGILLLFAVLIALLVPKLRQVK